MPTTLAFIGSGLATSYTLIPLLDELQKKDMKESLELVIIDKNNDFFKGLPYGNPSGKSVLLIQDLKNFISEPHRTFFKDWLNEKKDRLIAEFLSNGKHYAKTWVEKNAPKYEVGDWDDLYIPRFFFGSYLDEQVVSRIKAIEQRSHIAIKTINGEAVRVGRTEKGFQIFLNGGKQINAHKVVLSVGSLPYKKLYQGAANENALYIGGPYHPSINLNIEKVKKFVHAQPIEKPIKVLVMGANASGLEMIYKICDELSVESHNIHFTSLSSHGVMPDGNFDAEKAKHFRPTHLEALRAKNALTAEAIALAAHKDIDRAEAMGVGAATSVGIISNGFAPLLGKLSATEMVNFACFHGNQIGRRQRCAGNHYLSVVEELKTKKRFKHLKARFNAIEAVDKGLAVKFIQGENKNSETFDIVINCLGSQNLQSENLNGLIKSLIDKKLCEPNPSSIGFKVDDNMQASKNLFVAGPLLAGNRIDDKVFWHLEHCVRIIWSSNKLAEKLLQAI